MDQGDAREPVAKEVRLLVPIEKSQSPKRVTYGVVLEPDTEDLQGDVMSAEDIESAAYDWMEQSQSGGHMHSELVEGAKVVESYIAPSDIPIETAVGPETIKKGSWVLAMRWPEDIWSSIEKGDLTGYSVGGTGVRLALEEIGKHGDHDQSTHGNWARGGSKAEENRAGKPNVSIDRVREGAVVTIQTSDGQELTGRFHSKTAHWLKIVDGEEQWTQQRFAWVSGKERDMLVDPSKVTQIKLAPEEDPWDRPAPPEPRPEPPWVDRFGGPWGKNPEQKRPVKKHGSGDQSPHGNWARDRMTPAEEGNAAGRAEVHAQDEDPPYEKNPYVGDVDASRSSAEMKDLLVRGHATLDGVRRNKDGTYTATRAFASKSQFATEAQFARAIDYAAGQQNLEVRILAADEYGERTGEGGRFEVRFSVRPKEPVDKHGHHDQSTHGNWAHPGAATGGYAGAKPGSYVTFHDGVKARIVSIHEDGAIQVQSPDLPGSGDMLLLRGQIDSEGIVDLAPKTHPGPYEHTSAYGGMDPATRGAAAEGGGTPADHGIAAAQNESFPVYTEQIDSQGRIRQVRVDVPKEEADWKAGYGQDASQGWEAEAGYPTFTRGQKVRSRTGQIRTVHSQRGSQVFVEEESNGWHHPSKLIPVYWSNELGWVTIPDREDEVKKDGDHDQPVHESLAEIVRDAFAEQIAKHGSGDQKPHGNWADGRHEEGGAATIREGAKVEFANGDTGTIEEIEWGSLGWPTTYRVKLDAESVGTEGDRREYLSGVKRSEIRTRRSVKKHGTGDQTPHGNWVRATAETGKPYTNTDGVNMRDQPKVKRTSGGDYLETENGVQVDTRYYRNANGSAPKIHQWGPWALFPGHGIEATKNIDEAIWSNPGETLPRFMARLKPGEYVLGS